MQYPKRLVAKERKIKELTENDQKVRILGIVVNSTPNSAILDDGTGVIQIRVEQPLKEKGRYRIIGQVYKKEQNKFEIVAEIIQNMDKLDIQLYQKVNEIKKEFDSTNQELEKNN